MKKFFACMVALMAMSTVSVYADQHSAMLEQGDFITLFYGADALQQAYAVADSGAVITLSKGGFTGLTIDKPITVVGYYGFSDKPAEGTVIAGDVTITANKVTVDGVRVTGSIKLGNISDCKIKHTWFASLNTTDTAKIHLNTVIDQCVIEILVSKLTFALSQNFVIKNSSIRSSWHSAHSENPNPIYMVNNVVYILGYVGAGNANNNIANDYTLPYGIYHNNVFVYSDRAVWNGNESVLSQKYASSYLNNAWCISLGNSDKNDNASRDYGMLASVIDDVQIHINSIFSSFNPYNPPFPAYPINPGLGSDGTPRGPLGGTGFTDRPSIPRITGRDIDLTPDSIGNINIKISVSAE